MKPTVVILLALLAVPVPFSIAGATGFQTAVTTAIPPYAPDGAAFGDFNGDGNADLALTLSTGSNHYLRILNGDGSGNLTFATDLATASGSGGIVAADLNGDGITDLALTNTATDSISIVLSNGDGTFQSGVDYAVGTAPTALAIGDFRGDGVRDDLAVVNSGANSVAILLNDGTGILTAQAPASWPTAPDALAALAAGDFDGDDIDDLAVARSSANRVRIFFGTGIGTFAGGSDVTVGSGPSALAATDLNSDGVADLAVVNGADATVAIIPGNHSRTLTVTSASPVTSPADTGANPNSITTADFNRDGITDIAVANGGTGTLSVLGGRGDGTLATAESFPTGAAPFALAAGELDGSGTDLLSVSIVNSSYSLLLNSSPTAAGLSVLPAAYDFGTFQIGHIAYRGKLLTLLNTGSAPLAIGAATISGTDSDDFQASTQDGATCSTTTPTLDSGRSCTILAKFMNPITEGYKTASLNLSSNAAARPTVTVPLAGTGTPVTAPYTIAITFLGRGHGSASFSTGDAACTADCIRTPPETTTLSLTATPDPGSYLYGWNGCDWLYNGGCRINFSASEAFDRNLTVNFGAVARRLMVATAVPVYAGTLLDAYDQAGNGDTIRMPAGMLAEALTMNRSIAVTLQGGYDSGLTAPGALPTILKGITVSAGSAVLDAVVLQ